MNIELLSKMVKELLLDNDVVGLPALGSFVAEVVPASFSDSGHTINPPYRKLYFRENIEGEDALLVRLYVAENGVTEEVATNVINGFIAEVKELLNSRKSIVLPELGRLRATKENNYFFVPFENMDIYPEGEGLEPVPLKIRTPQNEMPVEEPVVEPSEETPEEPAEEISTETSDIGPVVLDGVEVVRLDGSTEGPSTAAPKSTLSKGRLTAIIVIGSILLAAALFVLLFIILSYLCPSFIDTLIYH